MKLYSFQQDSNRNGIVCGDTNPRNGYCVVAIGTYSEMLALKVAA